MQPNKPKFKRSYISIKNEQTGNLNNIFDKVILRIPDYQRGYSIRLG